MDYRFGSKELERCLVCLGFSPRQPKATHKKYDCPKDCQVLERTRPFIIIVFGKRQYDDISASKWIKQIKNLGITDKQISDCLK